MWLPAAVDLGAIHPDVVIVDATPSDPAGFLIAHRLQALPDAPPVELTSSVSGRQFGSQLDRHPFIAKMAVLAAGMLARVMGCG
jgi:hypothetical protein